MSPNDFSTIWLRTLGVTLAAGDHVSPRGKLTKELIQRTVSVNMRKPVLVVPNRKLSYTFMLAEAFWILSGDNRVATIAPYNKRIVNFSDDGETFFGAYGPKISNQLDYVVQKLLDDPNTRQAGINIWRECPPETKDVPCTISIFFSIRLGKLICNVFMRSSDIWLGLPYDVFNFSMLTHLVAGLVNTQSKGLPQVSPGILHLTAASSHLYEENFDDATSCLAHPGKLYVQDDTPDILWQNPDALMSSLKELRDSPPGSENRWWKKPDYL